MSTCAAPNLHVPDVRALADAYGVRVEVVDLGDWGRVRLIAEYDPEGPAIRVNRRELPLTLRRAQGDAGEGDVSGAARRSVDRAIAHELYHHREAIGEVPRIANHAAREAAADAFADALLIEFADGLTDESAVALVDAG